MTMPIKQNKQDWSGHEISILRKYYPTLSISEIKPMLPGRRDGAIYRLASALGLAKVDTYWDDLYQRKLTRGQVPEAAKRTQFKPGQKPWNAGMKGWSVSGSEQNWFKPGQRPHNERPIGSYRITTKDRYLEQKISDQRGSSRLRWQGVHVLVWIQANGPVPPKHIVRFKPGCKTTDPKLITLDRIECISMAENARRNHPFAVSHQVGQLLQLKGQITRQVNRIARDAESKSA